MTLTIVSVARRAASMRVAATRALLLAAGLLLVAASPAHAADFYVDPATGSDGNDGSAARPWRTLQAVIEADKVRTRDWDALPWNATRTLVAFNPTAPVKPGDTIWLRSGNHGELRLRGAYNTGKVTIAAVPGQVPRLSRIVVEAAQNWVLRGLSVSPPTPATPSSGALVVVQDSTQYGPAYDIELDGLDVSTASDSTAWGVAEWLDARSGVTLGAARTTLRNSRIRNVRFGLAVTGVDARVTGNTIDGFSADGIRGLGDRGTYEYNVVRNSFLGSEYDANHDDGFQSWSTGPGGPGSGEVRGIVLRGNTFIAATDPSRPLHGKMQGIGCFDGFFVDWVVENNVVVTDHWHGITFMGMRNSRIANNTVMDLNTVEPGPPWIQVAAHKDGRRSQDVVVRNNLAMKFLLAGDRITDDRNIDVASAAAYFVAWPYNLRLKPGAPAIDAGSSVQAPALDVRRVRRPQGVAIDVGAYEYCSTKLCRPVATDVPAGGTPPVTHKPRAGRAGADAPGPLQAPGIDPRKARADQLP